MSETKPKKHPTHTAYQVGEAQTTWSRVASAWLHNDGQGSNI